MAVIKPHPAPIGADGEIVEVVRADTAGRPLLLALLAHVGLTHREAGARSGVRGPTMTSYCSGTRQMLLRRLAEINTAMGRELRLVSVPVVDGQALPTQADLDQAVADGLVDLVLRLDLAGRTEVSLDELRALVARMIPAGSQA